MAYLLLRLGGEPAAFETDEQGNSALHVASFCAEDDIARLLVVHFPGLLQVKNRRGRFVSRLIRFENRCAAVILPPRNLVAGHHFREISTLQWNTIPLSSLVILKVAVVHNKVLAALSTVV